MMIRIPSFCLPRWLDENNRICIGLPSPGLIPIPMILEEDEDGMKGSGIGQYSSLLGLTSRGNGALSILTPCFGMRLPT